MMDHGIDHTIETFEKWEKRTKHPKDKALINQCVRALKDIKASLLNDGTMKHKLTSFEKLLCDPWLEDRATFDGLYGSWHEFKESYQAKVSGMTVNERLVYMGLMDEFEQAAGHPDRMRSVLRSVFLTNENIEAIVRYY